MKNFYLFNIAGLFFDESVGYVIHYINKHDKNTSTIKINAVDLFNNSDLLSNFSPLDVKIIACVVLGSTQEIKSVTFNRSNIVINILNKITNKNKNISVDQLLSDKKMLFSLSKEDICKVYYQAFMENKSLNL